VGVAGGTSAMTSGWDGAHPADSTSGPFGCPRYREKPDSKFQRTRGDSAGAWPGAHSTHRLWTLEYGVS
jgi:hypothetical protein